MIDSLTAAEAYLQRVDLLDAPGAVLYSAAETLTPGPVYLMGLNPGGSEGATLRDSIAASRRGHNCYLDEAWAPGGRLQPVGRSTLQRRVQHLCATMGIETRRVPASNLVFTRSTRVGTHLNFGEALTLCRPVHQMFMDAIRPSFLMTFGSMDNFRQAVEITSLEERSAEHGTWIASDKRSQVVEWATAAIRAN